MLPSPNQDPGHTAVTFSLIRLNYGEARPPLVDVLLRGWTSSSFHGGKDRRRPVVEWPELCIKTNPTLRDVGSFAPALGNHPDPDFGSFSRLLIGDTSRDVDFPDKEVHTHVFTREADKKRKEKKRKLRCVARVDEASRVTKTVSQSSENRSAKSIKPRRIDIVREDDRLRCSADLRADNKRRPGALDTFP